jgi:hypothetical protein
MLHVSSHQQYLVYPSWEPSEVIMIAKGSQQVQVTQYKVTESVYIPDIIDSKLLVLEPFSWTVKLLGFPQLSVTELKEF